MEESRSRAALIGCPARRRAHRRSHVAVPALLGNGAHYGRPTIAPEDGVVLHLTGGRCPRRIAGGRADEAHRLRRGVAIPARRRLPQAEVVQGRMEIAWVIRPCARVDMAIPPTPEGGPVHG